MKKKTILLIVLLAIGIFIGYCIYISNTNKQNISNETDEQEIKIQNIEFGTYEVTTIQVVGYKPKHTYYKITENKEIYYFDNKIDNEEKYVKQIDNNTFKAVKEYIDNNINEIADENSLYGETGFYIKVSENIFECKESNINDLKKILDI